MEILKTVQDVRRWRRAQSRTVGLVPTMGALHAGHLSLVRHCRSICDALLTSIFVNPAQFGPNEDLDQYPRPLEKDLERCREAGVDAVWTPQVDDVYPPSELDVTVDVPALTTILEGAHRPGHFVGVCRVVAKLFGVSGADVACFGQKDYQQLKVIEAMAAGLAYPVRIVPCPTVRDENGLALSSRNAYLDAEQHKHALGLSKALTEAAKLIQGGEIEPEAVERAMGQILAAHQVEVDYAVVRDARTLQPIDSINLALEPVVCLIAAKVGNVRLIDNQLFEKVTPASE